MIIDYYYPEKNTAKYVVYVVTYEKPQWNLVSMMS